MTNEPFAKKSLGQHWLSDQATLHAICDAAQVTPDDAILEIGPGPGTLTALLTAQARHVTAVEYDDELAVELPHRVPATNLTVVHRDILRFDLTAMPIPYKVVANIPYYLTSNLIRMLSEASNAPNTVVLLVQKEVAERAAARPGDMSVLSVTAQYYWEVSLGQIVPAALFTPPPKVDSQILIMHRRTQPLLSLGESKAFFRVVKAGFSQRRKTLLNSLSSGLRLDREVIKTVLGAAGLQPESRPQTLSLEDWVSLYRELNAS